MKNLITIMLVGLTQAYLRIKHQSKYSKNDSL